MKKIPLTRGKFANVDDIDFDYLSQWRWRLDKDGYAISQTSRTQGPRKSLKMHRIVLSRKLDCELSQQVDHRDRYRLNNRRSNLRLASYSEQRANARVRTGKFKGVYWYKPLKKWHAQITCKGKRQHLGYFDDPIEAAKAYNKAAKILFGEFANLNLFDVK